jgi:hypothetical protein
MAQAIIRVENGRIHFKCSFCQKRTTLAIPPNVCRKSVTCHNCGETAPCSLNRRIELRKQQSGKAFLTTSEGRVIDVELLDISVRGVGFHVAPKDLSQVKEGKEVNLRCTWNPRIFNREKYIIRSVAGQRIGAQRFQ